MTVRRVLDMLDIAAEEHKKAIRLFELSIERMRRMRKEIISAADELVRQKEAKRKGKNHAE